MFTKFSSKINKILAITFLSFFTFWSSWLWQQQFKRLGFYTHTSPPAISSKRALLELRATLKFRRSADRIINVNYLQNKHVIYQQGIKWNHSMLEWLSIRYHDTSWLPKIGVDNRNPCVNPKLELVRMIRTIFGIGTIRECVVSALKVEVELNLPIVSLWRNVTFRFLYWQYTNVLYFDVKNIWSMLRISYPG